MQRLLSSLAIIWRLARPYFFSEDRRAGRALLAAVIAMELTIVACDVLFNQWYNRFYNALQDYDWGAFVYELGFFSVLAAIYVVLVVYQLYLNQWLQIRWRQWMTRQYLDQWLTGGTHYRMQLLGDAADNPDQRIAEDIRLFVDNTLSMGLQLLNSIVSLASFVVILWGLSAAAPLYLFGMDFSIPGYLVWAALLYAMIGTVLTHFVGRSLILLNFQRQRYEADFRFALVRVRENSEQIALLGGEPAENERLLDRFRRVVANWRLIMGRTKRLMFLTQSYSQASKVFPFVLASPAYFAKAIQLGGLIQTASAFESVHKALSFFVEWYRNLAEWKAMVDRLDGFNTAVERARAAMAATPRIEIAAGEGQRALSVDDLLVRLPQGTPVVSADHFAIAPGDRVLVTGPSGAGKSTLIRALAGAWPFGAGRIEVPKGARIMALPQRPYLPIGTLAAAVAYPAEAARFDTDTLAEVLSAVGLPALAQRLREEEHWNRILSLGEQQRLGIARAILQAPDYLFLDEATASLDEPAEAALYRLIEQQLPAATVVSIGHRSTLSTFHQRRLALVRDGERSRVREAALEPAAE